jgi:hypothetical protein
VLEYNNAPGTLNVRMRSPPYDLTDRKKPVANHGDTVNHHPILAEVTEHNMCHSVDHVPALDAEGVLGPR